MEKKWLGDLLIDGVGSSLCSSVLGQERAASEVLGKETRSDESKV